MHEQERRIWRRFWSKVKTGSDCWEWQGGLNHHGYGRFCLRRGYVLAHRFVAELAFGDLRDQFVLHKCDNPACVRPSHLFLGTQADNIRDMVAKGRAAVGERSSSVVLTADQVVEIRRIYKAGGISHREIAKRFRVSRTQITRIISRRRWKHID